MRANLEFDTVQTRRAAGQKVPDAVHTKQSLELITDINFKQQFDECQCPSGCQCCPGETQPPAAIQHAHQSHASHSITE
eukprot:10428014-Karenia_brevis.AAC.1